MARNNANTTAVCHTFEADNPLAAEAARSIDAYSSVVLNFDAVTGVCENILVGKGSQYSP
jgi:hypothetical protein